MTLEVEVIGKFDQAGNADKLVYSPLPSPHAYRTTRRYTFEFDGPEPVVRAFARQTLVDDVSQDVHFGVQPALTGHAFIVEFGFKPGALDLEKETILAYYRGITEPGFALRGLTITRRVYIFSGTHTVPPERFVRDIVNPAIHRHRVIRAA
jgi:hypothetical protein